MSEIVTWYTRARRFPKYVGKAGLSGAKLWGGPYKVWSLIAGGATLVLGFATRGIWGSGHIIGDLVYLAAASWVAGWGMGKLADDGRNPLFTGLGLLRAMNPRSARAHLHLPKPRRVLSPTVSLGEIIGDVPAAVLPAPAPAPAPAAEPQLVPPPAESPRLTGVQQLLARVESTRSIKEAS